SSVLPVSLRLPWVWIRSVATVHAPVPICSPEGSWLAAPTLAPGWRLVWYIISSNTARLRLKPVVLTLARLLEITSMLVCWVSRPVLAIHRERIMSLGPVQGRRGQPAAERIELPRSSLVLAFL